MVLRSTKILDRAIELIKGGCPPATACEIAAATVAASPASRKLAARTLATMVARVMTPDHFEVKGK